MTTLHDEFYDTGFIIELLYGGEYEIDASCLEGAIDVLIDHFDTMNKEGVKAGGLAPLRGYFLTDEEVEEYENDNELENYICGGNYCQYLSFQWHEIRVTEIYK